MAREDDANNPDRLSNGSQFYIVWGKKYRPGDWPLPGRDYEVAYMVILKPTGKWSKNTSPPGAHRVRRRIHRIRRGHRRARCSGKHPIHRNRFPTDRKPTS